MKEEIKKILQQMESSKKIIAKERDKLRTLYDGLDELLDSFDRGIENIENGMTDISMGIDDLSECV